MQNLLVKDRRTFERFPAKLPLTYVDLNSNKEGHAHTVDISANGIGLLTCRELSEHTPLDIWLIIPDNGDPLYTRGEVVWSSRVEENTYRVGVKLEKPDFMGLSRVLRITGTNQDNHF